MSKRRIELEASPNGEAFKVLVIKGSAKYLPGDRLSKKQVETLCSTQSWSVRIREATRPTR